MARKPGQPLIEPGQVLREFSPAQARELATQWLAVFAANGRAPGTSRYRWHVFSYGSTPALALAGARRQYELESCAEYVVLSNERDAAFVTSERPTASSLRDWFVFPPNLAWTMAVTHEDGWLGPYFAKHPDYESLNAENRAQLRKRREADLARERGWT